VMLKTPGREKFQEQAKKSFYRQTYDNTHLISLESQPDFTIGRMRNEVNELAVMADIIVHWDDDDWSHPNRIVEQVALLQAIDADCVGYNEMLFWRGAEPCPVCDQDGQPCHICAGSGYVTGDTNGAWLYSNPNPRYALGTSLCYWRRAWEERPFPDLQHGEDTEWIRGLDCQSVSSAKYSARAIFDADVVSMIARIHSGNSSSAYDPIEMARHNVLPASERQWSRVPYWDKVCREVMER